MVWSINLKRLKKIKPKKIIQLIISKKEKIRALSPSQKKRRKKLLLIINKHEKKIEELLRIEIYDLKLLNNLVRKFLCEFYNLKLGFTSYEIKKELEEKKIRKDLQRRIFLFLEKLDTLRYGHNDEDLGNAKIMMEDLDIIIEDLKESI